MKHKSNSSHFILRKRKRILKIMKITILLFFTCVFSLFAESSYSQQLLPPMDMKNVTLNQVFSKIEKESNYAFLFVDDAGAELNKKINIKTDWKNIAEIVEQVLKNTDLTYIITNRQVAIYKKGKEGSGKETAQKLPQIKSPDQQSLKISGIVTDKEGEPLPGVTVSLKSDKNTVNFTDVDGKFLFTAKDGDQLVFTYIGMQPAEITIKQGQSEYKVVMEYAESQLKDVVIEAGIIQRNKLGFTGSERTISKAELKEVGSINVLQSLRSMDPSFAIAENNLRGSDPNTMANISLRGGSTMNITSTFDDASVNPNQPLFILDGFETTLQIINDMDINRIESITILKDAGSTAIYGSKGGNGVIIVETVKPKPGQLRVNYNADMGLSVADLSVYNLMNASEKLEFERLAGVYGTNWMYESNYWNRMENIKRGIDTYWLKVPIRTGLTQNHSLYIDGGESSLLYQLGAQYRNVAGVMKGSDRQTFGGNVSLQYRKNDKINVRNNLTVSVTNGYDGSWGSFSTFVDANPYYRMINEDGTIPEFLDGNGSDQRKAPNPYYNATLDSKRETKNVTVMNDTQFDWFIRPNLRWTSSLQIQTAKIESMDFKDPRHTDFYGKDYTLQGTYNASNGTAWKYSANTRLAYSVSIQKVHNLTFNARAAVASLQSSNDGYKVTGFPKGVDGIPTYSFGYVKDSRPSYSQDVKREASFLFNFSYNYLYRYLFDLSLNRDGSTAFGRNNKFQSFFSVGAGWNVSQESFAKDWKWMSGLKIRGSYGNNGNQNVGNIVSTNVYQYYPGSDVFGAAAYLSQFANPNLRWQVVKKASTGMDITLLDSRLGATIDLYHTKTNPLSVEIDQKPSSGVSKYPVNLGYITAKGLEFSTSYQIIKDLKNDILLSVRLSGITGKSKYGGFAKSLENLNNSYKNRVDGESQTTTDMRMRFDPNSLVYYRDGYSPDDLWAVRSLGIDPATGREIFLDKNGSPTFEYSADDRVVVGSKNPDLQGILGFTFRYKDLTASFNFRYSLGGYDLNRALLNKVENITSEKSILNLDKRALSDRWQNVGDVSQFTAIYLVGRADQSTPLSSRFIQRNNFLSGESARIAWDFSRQQWIKSLGINILSVSLSYSDLFYLSTMKRERGTDYPFARTVNMGISAQF